MEEKRIDSLVELSDLIGKSTKLQIFNPSETHQCQKIEKPKNTFSTFTHKSDGKSMSCPFKLKTTQNTT